MTSATYSRLTAHNKSEHTKSHLNIYMCVCLYVYLLKKDYRNLHLNTQLK